MSVAESWGRIVAWWEANTPSGRFRLNPSASPDEVDALERLIGLRLPADFRESLLIHNGGDDCWLLWYGELLSVEGIARQWEMYCKWQEDGGYATEGSDDWSASSLNGQIKPVFWNRRRIYVTDNSGDHLTLDLDPPSDERYGQIIKHSHEIGPEDLLAPGWATLLAQIAEGMENGVYVYDEDEETVCPPGMYD